MKPDSQHTRLLVAKMRLYCSVIAGNALRGGSALTLLREPSAAWLPRFLALLIVLTGSQSGAAQSIIDYSALQPYEARAVEVVGQVSRTLDQRPWTVTKGERVPVRQIITTGPDGRASFAVAGGSGFDLFSNSQVIFRQNTARAGDLLDVISGRVRVRLRPTAGQTQQRVFTPIANISATAPALISIAIDEDANVRIDVLEGEVKVQHRLLPRNEPTLVRAVDAILVQRDQQLTRKLDRGSLYRYAVKPLHDLWTAVIPGHPRTGEPIEGNKWLAAGTFRSMPERF